MKSKKGFMLGEYTLKIIIAVICIVLLIYLLYSLYSGYIDDKNRKLAEASLEELGEKMEEAKVYWGSSEMVLLGPDSWLGYWENSKDARFIGFFKAKPPKECIENCLCLCLGQFTMTEWGKDKDKVAFCKKPVCKNFDERVIIEGGSIRSLPKDIIIIYSEETGFTIMEK